jgi:hypothetical protein
MNGKINAPSGIKDSEPGKPDGGKASENVM